MIDKMRQEEHYDALSKIAPTVFSETLRGDWMINFELYSKALNKEVAGKEIMNEFNERIKTLSTNLGDKINSEVSLVRFLPSDIRIYHKDSFAGVILEKIKLKRPKAQEINDFAAKV